MDRIKRLSYEVLDAHKSKFGEDFTDNKKALDQISIIRSKGLKNEVAGYITKFIKKEIREAKAKQSREAAAKVEVVEEVQEPEAQEESVPEASVEVVEDSSVEPTTETSTEENSEEKTE